MTGRWSKRVVTIAMCDELGLEMWDDSLPPAPDHEMGMSEFGPHSPSGINCTGGLLHGTLAGAPDGSTAPVGVRVYRRHP